MKIRIKRNHNKTKMMGKTSIKMVQLPIKIKRMARKKITTIIIRIITIISNNSRHKINGATVISLKYIAEEIVLIQIMKMIKTYNKNYNKQCR